MQAYDQALRYIWDAIEGSMFVSLSIAPLFPGGHYAHARRVSCDAFGALKDSEYMLNSATYGWWLGGTVYRYNDPDHLVVSGHSLEEARTRVNAAVVGGSVFLDSDKLAGDPEAQGRARLLLTNADVNALARRGTPFQPLEGNTGTAAADVFVSGEGATRYIAVFNFASEAPVTKTVNLARAGLETDVSYSVRDLWSGARTAVKEKLVVALDKAASTLLELTPSEKR